MIVEIIVLALASTVRPTSLAVVYTLLSHGSQRFLWAYVIAGLAFCISFGVIVVGVFHGIHLDAGTGRTKGIAGIVGGTVILIFAAAVATGRVQGGDGRDAPPVDSRWTTQFERRLSVRTAAIAGPLTHVPGIFYLVALNLIVAHNPLLPGGIVAVLIFDVIWFTVPILALAYSTVRPAAAMAMIVAVQTWSKRNARSILLFTSTIVGAALLVRGLLLTF